ncbi:unnamed protein product, partial [Cladocopium goreaui]
VCHVSWTFPLDPRCRSLNLIASSTYMAQSDFWRLAPRPGVRAPRNDTELAPHCLVQGLRRAQAPVVAYIEMRYLPQVLDLLDASGSDSPGPVATAPFVLVTSGSDAPLTRALQRRLLRLPGFRACYSTNLHAPPEELKELFHPLPVGFLSGRLNAHNEACLVLGGKDTPGVNKPKIGRGKLGGIVPSRGAAGRAAPRRAVFRPARRAAAAAVDAQLEAAAELSESTGDELLQRLGTCGVPWHCCGPFLKRHCELCQSGSTASAKICSSSLVEEMRKASSMDVGYLSKALRGNLSDLPTMCSHETHEELLRDILQKTPRLNKEEAVRALRSAFPGADKAASSAFAASMVVCVQNIFAKRKSMTSGKKLSPSLVRLISLADELYPAERRDRMAEAAPAASAAAGSKAAALPVAASSRPSRQLKKVDSIVSVSSAASCGEAMRIATPPREAVAALYRPAAAEHVYYTDAGRQTMIRIGHDGAQEAAQSLSKGSSGFVLATFADGEQRETELPNLILEKKTPPAPKRGVKKRPAAAQTVTEAAPVNATPANPESANFRLEYRSKTNAYSIRKASVVDGRCQKRQIVEIVGRNRISKEALSQIATEVRNRLVQGECEEAVAHWAKTEVSK